jgi:hypothetical protein
VDRILHGGEHVELCRAVVITRIVKCRMQNVAGIGETGNSFTLSWKAATWKTQKEKGG